MHGRYPSKILQIQLHGIHIMFVLYKTFGEQLNRTIMLKLWHKNIVAGWGVSLAGGDPGSDRGSHLSIGGGHWWGERGNATSSSTSWWGWWIPIATATAPATLTPATNSSSALQLSSSKKFNRFAQPPSQYISGRMHKFSLQSSKPMKIRKIKPRPGLLRPQQSLRKKTRGLELSREEWRLSIRNIQSKKYPKKEISKVRNIQRKKYPK